GFITLRSAVRSCSPLRGWYRCASLFWFKDTVRCASGQWRTAVRRAERGTEVGCSRYATSEQYGVQKRFCFLPRNTIFIPLGISGLVRIRFTLFRNCIILSAV